MKLSQSLMGGLLVVALGSFSQLSMANPHQQDAEPQHKRHQLMMEKLGVNEQQKAQLDALHQEQRAAMQAHKQQIRALRKQQKALLAEDELNKQQLQSLLRQQADLKAEMMAQKHQHRKQVMAVLNEEQRAKMQQLRQSIHDKRKQHREHHKQMRAQKD